MTATSVEEAAAIPTRVQDLKSHALLIVGCLVGMMTNILAVVPPTIGATIPLLEAEYGWDRAMAGSLLTVAGIATGLFGIVVARMIDRIGLRAVLFTSIGSYTLCQFALGGAFAARADVVVIQALFLLLGIAGAGASLVSYTRAIIGRLSTARGMALGIMGIGTGVAGVLYPFLVVALLPVIGLPSMHVIYGVLALVPVPLLIVALRRPERSIETESADPRVHRSSILKSSVLWRMFAIFALMGTVAVTINTHAFSALSDRGIAPVTVASLVAMVSVGSVAGRLIAGYLLDLVPTTGLFFVFFLIAAPSFALVLWGPVPFVYVGLFAVGTTLGAETDFLGYYLSRRQGTKDVAFAMSVVFFGLTFFGGLAPFVTGVLYEAIGSYAPVAIYIAAAAVLSAILVLTLPRVAPLRRNRAISPSVHPHHL